MSKTVILVCAHKRDECLDTPPYMPIQVGKAISGVDLGFTGDDTGDNISARNRNFCELTAHYWAWKNLRGVDYIGLCHYRRYFDFGSDLCNVVTAPTRRFFDSPHPVPDFDALFSRCDIVMSKPKPYPYNLYRDYSRCHRREDLDTLRDIVAELTPDYVEAFDEVFFRNNRLSHFNMFVMPWSRFEEYSEWLFTILFEAGRRIPIPDDPVQARIFGYMSERLMSVYARRNRLRVKYQTVVMVNDAKRKGKASYIYHCVMNNLLYFITWPFYRHRAAR